MKGFIVILLLLTTSVYAFNEVECNWNKGPTEFIFEVRQFPSGSFQKEAYFSETNGDGPTHTWKLFVNRWVNMGRVNYRGEKLEVDINIWPDQVPRWGRMYPAYVYHSDANGYAQAYCRFPSARP